MDELSIPEDDGRKAALTTTEAAEKGYTPGNGDKERGCTLLKRWIAILAPILPIVVLVLLLILLLRLTQQNSAGGDLIGCDANGKIYMSIQGIAGDVVFGNGKHSYTTLQSRWNRDSLFTITLAFGTLNYTHAKVIDEAWNLVVGRGSQFLAGLILYRAFKRRIAKALSKKPRPYQASLALEYSTVSINSLWQYLKSAVLLYPRSTRAFTTVLLLTAFIIATPTWLSAMTGYRAKLTPVLPWFNSTYISLDRVSYCIYAISDGARIGQPGSTCISSTSEPLYAAMSEYMSNVPNFIPAFQNDIYLVVYGSNTCDTPVSKNHWNICDGWMTLGCESWFSYRGRNFSLESPSFAFSPSWWEDYGTNYISNDVPRFAYENKLIDGRDILAKGICQPQAEYQWGFSFLLTFAFLVTAIVFSLTLSTFWIFTYDNSVSDRLGPYKTVITVEKYLRRDIGPAVTNMTNKEIEQALRPPKREKETSTTKRRRRWPFGRKSAKSQEYSTLPQNNPTTATEAREDT